MADGWPWFRFKDDTSTPINWANFGHFEYVVPKLTQHSPAQCMTLSSLLLFQYVHSLSLLLLETLELSFTITSFKFFITGTIFTVHGPSISNRSTTSLVNFLMIVFLFPIKMSTWGYELEKLPQHIAIEKRNNDRIKCPNSSVHVCVDQIQSNLSTLVEQF